MTRGGLMRRGPKPAKSKEAKPPVARKSPKSDGARVRDLEKRLAEAEEQLQASKRELGQAEAQQTATSEILKVISSVPSDVQPVLDAVAENAARLCGADDAVIRRIEGDVLRLVARFGSIPQPDPTRPISRDYPAGLAVIERRTVHIEDISPREETEFPRVSRGLRTVLATPLLREGVPIGVIAIVRTQVQPFTDKQIELVETFANQAVIAIENVRLFNETKDALERQTATSEILSVISSSPTDTQPVFDAIARSAVALCGGIAALVLRYDGEMLHIAGHHEMSRDAVEQVKRAFPRRPGRDYPSGRALLERLVVHVPDLQAATEFTTPTARQRGLGSMLVVPLLREGEAIGVISLGREVAGPFSAQQIEVVQTFADQAVIAIENVRLFNETKEALDQQTATSEILRVISSSPTDVQPVLDAVAQAATGLCDAYDAWVGQLNGDVLRVAAHHGSIPVPVGDVVPAIRGTVTGRSVIDRRTVHVADLQEAAAEYPEGSELAQRIGFRTALSVPLLREGMPIGVIHVRRYEVRHFSDKQIALLQTFADQAVIAIENVRLFNETKEALERQTATSEILRVISSSPTHLHPVPPP